MKQVPEKQSARVIAANPLVAGLAAGEATTDRIKSVRLSLVYLPLAAPISDAKVLTGRQKPLTEIAFLFAEIQSQEGHEGIGFSYSKRAGGPGPVRACRRDCAGLIGEDPNDIARLWDKLVWAGASVGRSGVATQAIAAFDIALWDLKAKRAGLPLAKLLGAHRDSVRCYNTSGGFLSCRSSRSRNMLEIARAAASAGSRSRSASPTRWSISSGSRRCARKSVAASR